MESPLCRMYAARQVLCADCERKLASGAISEYDVEVARALHELIGDEAGFIKAVDTEGKVIVVAKPAKMGRIIGLGGVNLRDLAERVGKPVKVVGQGDFNDTAATLVAPARINGINSVLKPGGGKAIRVRVNRQDKDILRMPFDDIRRLIAAAADCEVDVVFD